MNSTKNPIIVMSTTTSVTGWLFTNPINTHDKNIYGIVPFHSIKNFVQIKSDRFLVVGNDTLTPESQILINGIYLRPANFLLDAVIFVVQDPEKIRLSFLNEYLNVQFNNTRDIVIKNVDILSIYNGEVSAVSKSLLDKNYIIGSREKKLLFQIIPEPGLLLIDEIARVGLSGSPVTSHGKIYGFISRSSVKFDSDESIMKNCLAINSYYLYPWIIQVVDSIYKYIGDTSEKINSLLSKGVMERLRDNITPSVLSLGCSTIHFPYGNKSDRRLLGVLIYIVNDYLYQDEFYKPTGKSGTNSIAYKTLLNTNEKFINEFNSNVVDCTYIISKIEYTDRLTSLKTSIDYIDNVRIANFNEYYFRGSSEHDVKLTIKKETRTEDNVSSETLEFIFYPIKTSSEVINGVDYNRQSSEVPKMYFNDRESLYYNYNSGNRFVDNYFTSSSVDMLRNGPPGIIANNSYL